ncbi:hypothetical protein EU527_02455 [Candidatus Thorarchaeota archaeon]|nr:MAG: hypothetical protein EU527_02455 [Candidatus Thorarchaeota archaeon]
MAIMSKLVPIIAKRKAKEIEYILNNPIELTEAKLKSILEKHSNTAFGRDHRFESINSPEQFSEDIPLYDYYSMQPYFKRVQETPDQPIITKDPVIWYVQSSGTSGKPKALPISKSGMADYSSASTLFMMSFINAGEDHKKVFDGTLLTFAAPARLGNINGVPLGYMTGIAREMIASPLLKKLVKPGEEVFNMTNVNEKLWAYATYAVRENISGLAGITTLAISFIRKMQNEYGYSLLQHFKGTKYEHKIRNALNDDGTIDFNTLWPGLVLIGATGIDAEPYKSWLSKTLPDATLWDNYAGSEGLYGTTLWSDTNNGIQLLPHINYFEFIPESEVDKEEPEVIPLSEVKRGHRYEIVISNMLGYTRYRIGDMLTFIDTDPYSVYRIGRKGKVVNLAGEKMTDAHVNEGISKACKMTGAELLDYTVYGSIEGSRAHYTISAMFQNEVDLSEFAQAFDDAVMANNGEFKHSLEFGALNPTVAIRMEISHTEKIIASTHIQAKSRPLSDASPAITISSMYEGVVVEDGV